PLAAPVTAAADPFIAVIRGRLQMNERADEPGSQKVPFFRKLEPNHKAVSRLNPDWFDEHTFMEAAYGTIKTPPRDRTGCRRRPDATRNDLSAAGGERDGRHRMRQRGGRRTGAGAGGRQPRH